MLASDVARRFFAEVNRLAKRFMSDEHFTVAGTLIKAGASQKRFRKKDGSGHGDGANFEWAEALEGNPCVDHRSGARLYKKSYGSRNRRTSVMHCLRTATV